MVKLAKQPEPKEKKIKITKEGIRNVFKYLVPLLTPFLCFLITEFTWRINSNGVLRSNPFETIITKLMLLNLLLVELELKSIGKILLINTTFLVDKQYVMRKGNLKM